MNLSFIFAQVGGVCTQPNAIEWVTIIALISGAGIFSVMTGVAAISVGSTIVSMAISGASISTIATAVSGDAFASYGGAEVLASLVAAIMNILGC